MTTKFAILYSDGSASLPLASRERVDALIEALRHHRLTIKRPVALIRLRPHMTRIVPPGMPRRIGR